MGKCIRFLYTLIEIENGICNLSAANPGRESVCLTQDMQLGHVLLIRMKAMEVGEVLVAGEEMTSETKGTNHLPELEELCGTVEEKDQVVSTLAKFPTCSPKTKLMSAPQTQQLIDNAPCRQSYLKIAADCSQEIRDDLRDLLETQIIQPYFSPCPRQSSNEP